VKNYRFNRLLKVVFVSVFFTLFASCVSINVRQNAHKRTPPNPYPTVRTLFVKKDGGGGGGGGDFDCV